jgi:hypothetical protein
MKINEKGQRYVLPWVSFNAERKLAPDAGGGEFGTAASGRSEPKGGKPPAPPVLASQNGTAGQPGPAFLAPGQAWDPDLWVSAGHVLEAQRVLSPSRAPGAEPPLTQEDIYKALLTQVRPAGEGPLPVFRMHATPPGGMLILNMAAEGSGGASGETPLFTLADLLELGKRVGGALRTAGTPRGSVLEEMLQDPTLDLPPDEEFGDLRDFIALMHTVVMRQDNPLTLEKLVDSPGGPNATLIAAVPPQFYLVQPKARPLETITDRVAYLLPGYTPSAPAGKGEQAGSIRDLGTIVVEKDSGRVMLPAGLRTVRGRLLLGPQSIPYGQFEGIAESLFPAGSSTRIISLSGPDALKYMAPTVNRASIALVAARIRSDGVEAAKRSPEAPLMPQSMGVPVILLAGDPVSPTAGPNIREAFAFAAEEEGRTEDGFALKPGTVPVAGVDIEVPDLAKAREVELDAIKRTVGIMSNAGGVTFVHYEAGHNVETFEPLCKLFAEFPNHDFILVLDGAQLGTAAQADYLAGVRHVLRTRNNVHFDISLREGVPASPDAQAGIDALATLAARYEDRFILQHGVTAASVQPGAPDGSSQALERARLVEALKLKGAGRGYANLPKRCESNFRLLMEAAIARVRKWRSDREVVAWVAKGGPRAVSLAGGTIIMGDEPPKKWVKDSISRKWDLLPTQSPGPDGPRTP